MKIVVGLGNPGRKYDQTRHNVGFDVIEELARRHFFGRTTSKHQGEIAETMIGTEKVLLVQPTTYMNLSGQCVAPLVNFYKLDLEDVLVICDDLNLPAGKLRLKGKGSSGGQNGLKDLIQKLGGDQFPRLRIGIGPVPPQWDAADFVLGKFNDQEIETIGQAIKKSADAVETWIKEGLAATMNRFNTKPQKAKKKKKDPAEPETPPSSQSVDPEKPGQKPLGQEKPDPDNQSPSNQSVQSNSNPTD